jgi:hypothetical protein
MGSRRYQHRNGTGTLITYNVILISSNVSSIWVNVYTILTLENTSEGVTGVINIEVSVEGRGIIKNTSHG